MRFLTIFRHQLRNNRAQILGWGIALFVLAAYLAMLHDAFISQQEQFNSMMSAYPPELMAAFGGTEDLFIPSGFLNFTFFSYAAVLLCFLAISMGSGLLSADEERGRLELVVAYPVSRMFILTASLAGVLLSSILILLLSWLGFVLTIPGTGLAEVSPVEMALPHLELLVLMIFFIGMALLLSQVLPMRRAASGLASGILLASYVLKILLELNDKLADLSRFSPLHYIKGGYAIEGLNAGWIMGLLGCGLLFIALAAWRFERRDLRISGEGSFPALIHLGKRGSRQT
jgi:ABC-2 type transport system permease protein